MESFFGTLKTELVHHREYPDRETARRDLFAYIEGYYNRRRIHSAIGYITPQHDEPLRLRIQTQLNRGEARHGLARWLFFADQGEFRTSDFEMIMNKASCLSLLSNAVVLWNTLQLERIVTELRAGGTTIRDEDLVHVWPLQRRHITPNGVYFANRTMPAFVLPDPVEA